MSIVIEDEELPSSYSDTIGSDHPTRKDFFGKSAPSGIGWAMYLINNFDFFESGNCPYDLTFGTAVTDRRFDFPKGSADKTTDHQYVNYLIALENFGYSSS